MGSTIRIKFSNSYVVCGNKTILLHFTCIFLSRTAVKRQIWVSKKIVPRQRGVEFLALHRWRVGFERVLSAHLCAPHTIQSILHSGGAHFRSDDDDDLYKTSGIRRLKEDKLCLEKSPSPVNTCTANSCRNKQQTSTKPTVQKSIQIVPN